MSITSRQRSKAGGATGAQSAACAQPASPATCVEPASPASCVQPASPGRPAEGPLSLTEAAAGFAAIGSEARMLVLRSLVRAGETGRTVGEVQSATGIPASTLAHHLRFLTAAGLVIQERRGRSTINRAAYAHLNALAIFILDECCSEVAGEAIEGRIKP